MKGVKSILHEFCKCKIDFLYIQYYLAAKINFTRKPILAAPDLLATGRSTCLILAGSLFALLTTDRLSSKGNRDVGTETRFPKTCFRFHNVIHFMVLHHICVYLGTNRTIMLKTTAEQINCVSRAII